MQSGLEHFRVLTELSPLYLLLIKNIILILLLLLYKHKNKRYVINTELHLRYFLFTFIARLFCNTNTYTASHAGQVVSYSCAK